MTKTKGFTLLETLIVLGMVSLMFGFGMMQIKQVNAASQERHFWQSLRQNWQASQVRARGNNKGTDINYLPSRRVIRFSWTDQRIIPRHNDVIIPQTIQIVSFAKLRMLPNGYVKARTQKFYSDLTNQNYDMKIQLAWGGFYVETEK